MASLASHHAAADSVAALTTRRRGRLASRITDRGAGTAAIVAGVLSLITGVLQIAFPQDEDPTIDPRTRLILVMFSISLYAIAALSIGLTRHSRSSWGGWLAASGAALLTVGTVTSAANGIDLEFFPAVAMVANALWLVGTIALTVSLLRARVTLPWLVGILPLVQVALLLFSQIGGGVPAGAYLIALGAVLAAGRLRARRPGRTRRGE